MKRIKVRKKSIFAFFLIFFKGLVSFLLFLLVVS